MNDLATLTGQPRPLHIQGKLYWLYPQTFRTLGRFQVWLDMQSRDPESDVCQVFNEMPGNAMAYLLNKGVWRAEKRRVLIGSAEANMLAYSVGGISELLYLSIRRGRRFTRRAANALYWLLDDGGKRAVISTMWSEQGSKTDSDEELSGEDRGPETPIDWFRIVNRLSNDPYFMTLPQILGMTWPQFLCVSGDGKHEERITSAAEYQAYLQARDNPWE